MSENKAYAEMIEARRQQAEIEEAYDLAGVDYPDRDQQEYMEGFRGQPEKVYRKGRGSAAIQNSPYTLSPEASAAALANTMKWRRYGKAHPAKTNVDIENRIDEYFEECIASKIRPTVECLALAIGVSRMSLWNWKCGVKCDAERQRIVLSAYDAIATFDADMAINNQMNPVMYIYRSKNFYDMHDQSEIVVTPNNPLGDVIDADTIAEKYAYLPEE